MAKNYFLKKISLLKLILIIITSTIIATIGVSRSKEATLYSFSKKTINDKYGVSNLAPESLLTPSEKKILMIRKYSPVFRKMTEDQFYSFLHDRLSLNFHQAKKNLSNSWLQLKSSLESITPKKLQQLSDNQNKAINHIYKNPYQSLLPEREIIESLIILSKSSEMKVSAHSSKILASFIKIKNELDKATANNLIYDSGSPVRLQITDFTLMSNRNDFSLNNLNNLYQIPDSYLASKRLQSTFKSIPLPTSKFLKFILIFITTFSTVSLVTYILLKK